MARAHSLRWSDVMEQAEIWVIEKRPFLLLANTLNGQANLLTQLIERLAIEIGDTRMDLEELSERLKRMQQVL
jgi:hypothetical protein